MLAKETNKKQKIKLFEITWVMFKTNNGFYRNEKKKREPKLQLNEC
jgi:hypothetical protein